MNFKTNNFGYPSSCDVCKEFPKWRNMRVKSAFFKVGNEKRLMIIGQDPTIRKDPERVKVPLMLDDEHSQLSRWLNHIFGEELEKMTVYATNIVKCNFDKPPAEQEEGDFKFLDKFFDNCKKYLINEINNYKPTLNSALVGV
jgi:uracil-DNA glycosylase